MNRFKYVKQQYTVASFVKNGLSHICRTLMVHAVHDYQVVLVFNRILLTCERYTVWSR